MGNQTSSPYYSFEDVQSIVHQKHIDRHHNEIILINTLPETMQYCLIPNTESILNEVEQINHYLQHNTNVIIIIYGMHCCDDTVTKKYDQLIKLGFHNIYIYRGGMFEWLCLQDIYGDDVFPTTSKELDILKFKPIIRHNRLL